MNISKETQEILANFSTINQSIVLKPGKRLATISNAKTILAVADVEDTFDTEFGIYDLNQFLNVVSLFKEPEFNIGEKVVRISEDNEQVVYTKTEPSLIAQPPENVNFPPADVTFEISAEQLKRLNKTANLLGSPEVVIEGNREKITVGAMNTKNSAENAYRFEIGETDNEFRMIIKTENLKLMPKDYTVEISSKGISKWSTDGLTYWIAVDASSTFNA